MAYYSPFKSVELVLTAEQKKKMFSKKEWEDFHFSFFEEESLREGNDEKENARAASERLSP